MARSRVIILGAGGTGQDASDILNSMISHGDNLECLGFLDDRAHGTVAGHDILGPLKLARTMQDTWFVNALGSPRNFRERQALIETLGIPQDRYLTLVHPSAVVSPQASLGRGVILYPFVQIGAGAEVGDHVTVLSFSVINHHCRLGHYSILASHVSLCGGVVLGSGVYAGAGCSIRQNLSIGDGAMIGMGSVVVSPVQAGITVVGNPARELPPTDLKNHNVESCSRL